MNTAVALASDPFAADNVIAVDFRTDVPVVVNFADALSPKGDIAKRLAAHAQDQLANLEGVKDRKHGTLRLIANGRFDAFKMNPYLISMEDEWNSRDFADPENLEHIDLLARSIAKIGVQVPLTVRLVGEKAILTDGHLRWFGVVRAIEVYGAEIKSVDVVVESRVSSAADHLARQLLVGKQKSPIEQARVFVKLIKHGWSVPQIAETVGLGKARVAQLLNFIADANDAIKAMVVEGKVKQTEAERVLRMSGGDVAAAEQTLAAGVAMAKAQGKKRATAKHMVTKKLSLKAELAEIVNRATLADGMTLTFAKKADATRLYKLLGLGIV